ncbi:PepSY domain-containing protein [Bacillus sp. D386]|uniref:PepSY domain-containing protein n=1 Tax=Bacillus sp. D386 TaxID=2587155 RepID=UPI00111E5A4D|nr:PepSY domain-containing protein [Bacillus sp. D386]
MKINCTWILPVLLLIGIISLSLYAYNQILTKTIFGEAEIKNRVESLFNGQVQSVTKIKDQYEVTFSKNDFLYEVSVDETEGTFSNISLIKEGMIKEEPPKEEIPEEVAPAEEEKTEEKPTIEEPEAVKPLTEQQVIEIARSKFNGEVDEIEFVGTNEGGYYNVDIETAEDEATLQIHALTGEILTITYDD